MFSFLCLFTDESTSCQSRECNTAAFSKMAVQESLCLKDKLHSLRSLMNALLASQAPYVDVISGSCCITGTGRKIWGVVEGEWVTKTKESESLEYAITVLLHFSTMQFLRSPPLPPSFLSVSNNLRSQPHSSLPCHRASLSPIDSTFSSVRMTSLNLMNQRSSHSGWRLPRDTPDERAYWTRRCRI